MLLSLLLSITAIGSTPLEQVSLKPHQERLVNLFSNAKGKDIERTPRRPSGPKKMTVYGYHPYWGGDPTLVDMTRLTHLAIFSVGLEADGSVSDTHRWTDVIHNVLPLARAADVKVHLTATAFTDDITGPLLSDPQKRAAAVSTLADLVNSADADGVNIDIEGLEAEYKDDFSAFVEEMAAEVDEVYVATPAIDWKGAYDYDRLANASDGLFIMGYGYHWSGGDPGPVDPLYGGTPWSDYSLEWTLEDYRTMGTPDDKIIMGLPLYGREWPTVDDSIPGSATGEGSSITLSNAIVAASSETSHFDTVSRTPYVLYPESQMWFCNTESIEERIEWIDSEAIGGVGFWALTYEEGVVDFWNRVSAITDEQPVPEDPVETSIEANAGLDISVEVGELATLNGTGSIDSEESAAYLWKQISGPTTTIHNADRPIATVETTEEGELEFELTLSHNGIEDTDSMTLTVSAPAPKGCSQIQARPSWILGLCTALVAWRRKQGVIRSCQRFSATNVES